jgi:hypothetical protein
MEETLEWIRNRRQRVIMVVVVVAAVEPRTVDDCLVESFATISGSCSDLSYETTTKINTIKPNWSTFVEF